MKTPPLYYLPPFSNFVQPLPLPCQLQPPPPIQILFNLTPSLSTPTPTPNALSLVLFLWLNGWLHHIWCATLLNDIMDLHISSLGNLVPEEPRCVFYTLRHQVYWGLTHNMVFCWYSDSISHTLIHTQRHIIHLGAFFFYKYYCTTQ